MPETYAGIVVPLFQGRLAGVNPWRIAEHGSTLEALRLTRPEPALEGRRMAVRLNRKALAHARKLIEAGKVERDIRDDWSEHAPSTEQENSFIDKHGFGNFEDWHLGRDDEKSEGTKGSVSFPFGDFSKVHRCAVISLESRAAQYGHDDIRDAAKKLLELMDSD